MSSEITSLEKARELLSKGATGPAEEILKVLINSRHQYVASESLFLLGCGSGLSGDHVKAAHYFERCLSISPENLRAKYNLAKSHEEQGSTSLAVKYYEAVLLRDPRNQDAKLNCANCLLKEGQFEKAEDLYTQILGVCPDLASALTGLGCCLVERGAVLKGCELHSRAIRIAPEVGQVWNNLAVAFRKLWRESDCLHCHSQAISLSPNCRAFYTNKISSLLFFGLHDKALEALSDVPSSINPSEKSLAEIRAEVHRARGELESSLASISSLLCLENPLPSTYNLYGLCLRDFGALEEARSVFETILKDAPDNCAARFNLSLVLLESFQFARGWIEYWNRWKTRDFPSDQLETRRSENCGGAVNRLLVFGEQGVGEQLMFLHGLNFAKGISNHTLSSIDGRLIPLAKMLHPEVVFIPSSEKPSDAEFDEFCYAGDLFGRWHSSELNDFHGLSTIPLPNQVPAAASRDKLRVGLSWRSKNRQFGGFKSPPAEAFKPLISLSSRAEFVNLQYGWEQGEIECFSSLGIELITDDLIDLSNDFLGTATLIKSCDVVVSVSNSVAHLSGAVGVRTFVLVPRHNGRLWYWQSQNGQSYWYPKVSVLLPQEGWGAAVEELARSIEKEFLSPLPPSSY